MVIVFDALHCVCCLLAATVTDVLRRLKTSRSVYARPKIKAAQTSFEETSHSTVLSSRQFSATMHCSAILSTRLYLLQ